ncbi:hypothetical protein F6455_13875 [Proteobacteria bacterium 005FR1]|nr:hypothetical protein [Proteobacteria bacterium 005FR1]
MPQQGLGHVSAAELEAYLADVRFPADKDTIFRHITHEGAPRQSRRADRPGPQQNLRIHR